MARRFSSCKRSKSCGLRIENGMKPPAQLNDHRSLYKRAALLLAQRARAKNSGRVSASSREIYQPGLSDMPSARSHSNLPQGPYVRPHLTGMRSHESCVIHPPRPPEQERRWPREGGSSPLQCVHHSVRPAHKLSDLSDHPWSFMGDSRNLQRHP